MKYKEAFKMNTCVCGCIYIYTHISLLIIKIILICGTSRLKPNTIGYPVLEKKYAYTISTEKVCERGPT